MILYIEVIIIIIIITAVAVDDASFRNFLVDIRVIYYYTVSGGGGPCVSIIVLI